MERDRAQSHGCLLPTAASRLGVRHTLRSLRVNVEEMKAEFSDSVWIITQTREGSSAARRRGSGPALTSGSEREPRPVARLP